MASTYVNDLRLNEMATGDGSGTWGTTTNTNLELIAEAFSYGTEVITTNADTHTTTIADGATDPGRSLYLKYTGTLDSACTITIGPNTVSKVWIIENGTSGSQDIILSQGSGANITIPAGDTKVVYSDGAGAGAAFFDAFTNLNVGAINGIASKTFGTDSIMIGDTTTGTIDAADGNTGVGVNVFAALTSGDNNTAVGYNALTAVGTSALTANTTGIQNVATGAFALTTNTTGGSNVAMGYQALKSNTTGGNNTAIGDQALELNTEGTENVAVGSLALDANTTGDSNTAVGMSALSANTTASNSVAVGYNSLVANTTGQTNIAIGALALTTNSVGNGSVAIGYSSGYASTASNNVSIGANSFRFNTTGANNVAVGAAEYGNDYGALGYNTTGGNNTAIGMQALLNNTTASNNTAVGMHSLRANTTASSNTAVGGFALTANTEGVNNTALGKGAGQYITTGAGNTMLGTNAGADSVSLRLTTGSGNICIGFATDIATPSDSYTVVIGYDITGKGSSTGFYGGSGAVYNEANTSTWSTVSDRRIKKNIEDNNTGLEAINQIQVKNFEYRTEDEIVDFDNPASGVVKKEGIQLGVIAQEIEEILPNMVRTESTGVKSIKPDDLTWYLVNAVKELSAQNDALTIRITALEG
jgi:trimeric autotransporter adhesin